MPALSEIIFRDQIDRAILMVLDQASAPLKTAKAIALVKSAFEDNDDITHEVIARRIYALVDTGNLTANGNIQKWRYSEIGLPD